MKKNSNKSIKKEQILNDKRRRVEGQPYKIIPCKHLLFINPTEHTDVKMLLEKFTPRKLAMMFLEDKERGVSFYDNPDKLFIYCLIYSDQKINKKPEYMSYSIEMLKTLKYANYGLEYTHHYLKQCIIQEIKEGKNTEVIVKIFNILANNISIILSRNIEHSPLYPFTKKFQIENIPLMKTIKKFKRCCFYDLKSNRSKPQINNSQYKIYLYSMLNEYDVNNSTFEVNFIDQGAMTYYDLGFIYK